MSPRGDLQLAFGYWFVTHKQQFKTWWAILLLGFLGLSAIWVVIFLSYWINQQPKLDKTIGQSALAIQRFAPPANLAPQKLQIGTATIIHRDSGHIDLVAIITNPNQDWGASELTYRFVVDNTNLPSDTAFVNPGASRPIIVLNQAMAGTSAKLEILGTTWNRAASAQLPTPNFAIAKADLSPSTVHLGDQTFLSLRYTANITNRSVYNFLKVVVPIVVKQNDTIVAVDEQSIDRWTTLTAKQITATWPFPISAATGVDVSPQVSQFDPDNLY